VIAIVGGKRVSRQVKWVGYRKLALDRHAKSAGLAPIRIKRGAMAEGLPTRDLLVSPPHCMFIDGKLVPAKLLVNDMSIVWDTTLKSVEYYHVELDHHAVLIAEGVAAESYLDTGNRAFFSNAGLALILHPEFHVNAGLRCWATDACAPLAVSPAAVLPVWRPLADRAIAMGYTPPEHATTTEADIHLVADGRRIDTIAVKGQVHSFMVPDGVKSLTLASRSVVPNTLTRYLDDPREIGVAVRAITIRGMAGRAEFAADHPALARGWHAPETTDGALWRWTKGNGALPVGVVDGPVIVDVTVGETTTYLIDDVRHETRAAA
jgi:antigen 43